ncbi:MAG: hypothetical protein INR62_10550, partial [Rhodospirillales bacterium]|nr:hypothetical protein [Acetobacter sp.]
MTTTPRVARSFLSALLLLAALPPGARSQPAATPEPWMGETNYHSFHLTGEAARDGSLGVEGFDTPAGRKEGFRFTVHNAPERALSLQALAPNDKPLAAGDTLFAHFYMRTAKSELES